MANASASSSIDFTLLNQSINRYAPMPFLFFGTIGNILNILVFTRKIFRNNICVMYFLASTIFDSLVIIVGLLPRLLNGYSVDPSQNSAVLCKLRFFLTYFGGYAAAWFISLACMERYLSSSPSVHRRNMITRKRACLSMIAVILMGFIFFGEQFYCIDINQQLLGAPQSCYQLKQSISCQIVDSIMQLIFQILTPAVLMLVFGLLILHNVHQQGRRINLVQRRDTFIPNIAMTTASHIGTQQPTTDLTIGINNQSSLTKMNRTTLKRDAQLITMLLFQVTLFVVTTFSICVYKLYSVATIYETKSVLRKSIENTVFNVSVISLFVNNSVTFYIYTLCGTVFRKELMKLFRGIRGEG